MSEDYTKYDVKSLSPGIEQDTLLSVEAVLGDGCVTFEAYNSRMTGGAPTRVRITVEASLVLAAQLLAIAESWKGAV